MRAIACACAAGCAWANAQRRSVCTEPKVCPRRWAGQSARARVGAPELCEGCSLTYGGRGYARCSGCLRSVDAGWALGSGSGSASARLPARRQPHTTRSHPTLTLPLPTDPCLRAEPRPGEPSESAAQRSWLSSLPRARSARAGYAAETPGSSHGCAKRPEGDEASTAEAEGVGARRGVSGLTRRPEKPERPVGFEKRRGAALRARHTPLAPARAAARRPGSSRRPAKTPLASLLLSLRANSTHLGPRVRRCARLLRHPALGASVPPTPS